MQVPDLPLPDDIIQKILIAVFGSGATIVGVFKVVNAIWAWIKLGKTGVRVGSRSIAAIQRVAVRLYEMRPIAILFGIITSITMFLLQALWLGVSYLIGNGLTWAFVGKPGMRGEPDWDAFIGSLGWDWISTTYVIVAFIVLIRSYIGDPDSALSLLVLPVGLVGAASALGAVLALLYSLLRWISDHEYHLDVYGQKTLALTAIAAVYIYTCFTIVKTPELLVGIWRGTTEDSTEIPSIPGGRFSGFIFGVVMLVALLFVFDKLPWQHGPTPSAAGGGKAHSSINVPVGYRGVWKGDGYQFDTRQHWSILMALHTGKVGSIAGVIAYPSLQCGGELRLLEATKDHVKLREDITFGEGNCTDKGSIVVRLRGGTLDWGWWYNRPDGDPNAKSRLGNLLPPALRKSISVPAGYRGVWKGDGYQFDTRQHWSILMALRTGKVGSIAGVIAYPSLQCGGELRLLEATKDHVKLREDITFGEGNCTDKGSIVVRLRGGTLDWRYSRPDGDPNAKSTLKRA